MKRYLACAILIVAGPSLAPVGYGQTVINSLPLVIDKPGKYVLQSDLTVPSGSGEAIVVTTSFVTIDLNGFTLSNASVRGSETAVTVNNVNNVVIENGTITGFESISIDIEGGSGDIVRNLSVQNFRFFGISLIACKSSLIDSCEVSASAVGQNNSKGIQILNGIGNRVVNTTVSGVGQERFPFGIVTDASKGNYFENDYIVSCVTGLSLGPPDKYRSITTTDCTSPIVGGTSVDGKSN